MAGIKNKEIKDKSKEDLSKLLELKKGELKDFRLGSSGSKSRNVREARMIRRSIARIMTAISAGSVETQ
jgi:ribosomal protein L29